MLKNITIKSLLLVATTLTLATFGTAQLSFAENQANKIVSIGGSVTEIIYALGEENRLIARDTTSVFPEAVLELPDVGYIRALSPEGVLSIDPELIVSLEGAGPPEAVSVIKSSGIPIIQIPQTYDEEGVISKIMAVGEALSTPAKALELVDKVKADFKTANTKVSSVEERKKVMFVLSATGGKIMAAGNNTSADGMIKLAGADNALNNMEGFKPVTDEAIIKAAPDFIVMMARHGDDDSTSDDALAYPAIAETPAGKNKALIKIDGLYLLGFGPRTGMAVIELHNAIYNSPAK